MAIIRNSIALGLALAVASTAWVGAAYAVQTGPSGPDNLYTWKYATVRGWDVKKFTVDRRGKRLDSCAATIMHASEKGLIYDVLASGLITIGFSGYGSAASNDAIDIEFWFDGDRSNSYKGVGSLIKESETGFEFRSLPVPFDEPGPLDSLRNASKLHVAYKVDGKTHIETFPLTGTAAAFTKVDECAGRI